MSSDSNRISFSKRSRYMTFLILYPITQLIISLIVATCIYDMIANEQFKNFSNQNPLMVFALLFYGLLHVIFVLTMYHAWKSRTRRETFLMAGWIICCCAAYGITLIFRVQSGRCVESYNNHSLVPIHSSFSCLSDNHGAYPEDSMVIALMLPIILSVISNNVHWSVALTAWVISFVSVIVSILAASAYSTLWSFIIFVPLSILSLIAVVDQHQRCNRNVIEAYELQLQIESNRINSEKEVRHLIGNLAHDLKTPLSAFLSGLEMITTVVAEVNGDSHAIDQSEHYGISTIEGITVASSNTDISSNVHPQKPLNVIPLNILIVDDSMTILKMTSMMLNRQGHKITTAENGSDALDILRQTLRPVFPINASGTSYSTFQSGKTRSLHESQPLINDGLARTSLIDTACIKMGKSFIRRSSIDYSERKTSVKLPAILSSASMFGTNKPIDVEQQRNRLLIIGCSANSADDTMEQAFLAGFDAFMPKPFTLQAFYDTYWNLKNLDENESRI
eukprot:gene12396-16626_t